MSKPSIVVVGADKGGVGKTTVARTICDYWDWKKAPLKSYDGQWPQGNLVRFNAAEVVNLSTVDGQMNAFDGLSQSPTIMLDLPAGMLSITLDAMDKAQLTGEVQDGNVNLTIMHIVGSNMASINEIADIYAKMGKGVRYFLVKNYASKDADFFEWDKDAAVQALLDRWKDQVVTVPHMEGRIYEAIEKAGGSFTSHGAGPWSWMRGSIRGWCMRVWQEYERVSLLGAIGA